jgi:protein arginine kinase
LNRKVNPVSDKFSDDHAVNDDFFGQFSHQSMRCDDQDGDVVVASRIQLLRNVAEHPFVGVSSEDQKTIVRDSITACIDRCPPLEDLPVVDSDQLREIERQFLLELQSVIDSSAAAANFHQQLSKVEEESDAELIRDDAAVDDELVIVDEAEDEEDDQADDDVSFEEFDFPELDAPLESFSQDVKLEDELESVFLQQIADATSLADFDATPLDLNSVDDDEGSGNRPSHEISITINDEDHLRLQVLAAGCPLNWMWERITGIDDQFEQSLNYAFSPQWGYLSASPANVGTGMRATVLMHLPALATLGRLEAAFMALMREGIIGRGVYGEEAWGDFFRIGNQVTLGKSESGLINLLKAVVPPLVEYERAARMLLFQRCGQEIKSQTEDAGRALKLQVKRSDEELLSLISSVRLGIALGMVSSDQALEVHSNFELTRLKRKLEVAVEMEHYVSATKYRDQIRQLEQRHYGH